MLTDAKKQRKVIGRYTATVEMPIYEDEAVLMQDESGNTPLFGFALNHLGVFRQTKTLEARFDAVTEH